MDILLHLSLSLQACLLSICSSTPACLVSFCEVSSACWSVGTGVYNHASVWTWRCLCWIWEDTHQCVRVCRGMQTFQDELFIVTVNSPLLFPVRATDVHKKSFKIFLPSSGIVVFLGYGLFFLNQKWLILFENILFGVIKKISIWK